MKRILQGASIAALALAMGAGAAQAQLGDGHQPLGYVPEGYPDWHSQWQRVGGVSFLPAGVTLEDVPLTEDGRAAYDAGKAAQAAGGQGNDPTYRCIPPGMPRAMTVVYPMEILITPQVTYFAIEYANQLRRVYTDGRDWPEFIEPQFSGYSIGEWEDTDGDGVYDVLHVETREMKGPRSFDSDGIPLHPNNETVVFERIALDPEDPDVLVNEITTHDDYLTEPWTTIRRYTREREPIWFEYVCAEDNNHVEIAGENYFISEDGLLMPTRENQPAPDLRMFETAATASQ